ncbi:calcium-binding protein [Sphingomonas sp.]|uniref:calcium-binding protein n=1 Tax=Sphingomonas sp. TaxID=28214 RepID=UPI003B3BA445
MTAIGSNLAHVTYWATQNPFIDRFKTAGDWNVRSATGAYLDEKPQVDEHGHLTGVGQDQQLSTSFAVDPLSAGNSNVYVLTYTGSATVRLGTAKIISQEAGKIVFESTNAADAPAINMLLRGMDPNDPVRDIHVVRQDQLDLFNAGEIFNPAFIDKASDWSVLRYMDWGNTPASEQVSWETRATLDNATWASKSNGNGVPIELMVELANKTGTDMWWNAPTMADDAYVTAALTYIRDHLDPSLKVHVEYTNEMWNWGYSNSKWALNKANEMWGVDVNKDGKIDPSNTSEAVMGGWMQFYGYRSAQIAKVAQDVFEGQPDDRLATVLATQTANSALFNYMKQGVARAGLGSVDDLFDEFAVTTYFGNQISAATSKAADKAKVLEWARSGEAGMAAAFRDMEFGGAIGNDLSLVALSKQLERQAAIAKANGMTLVAYEGGAHLTPATYTGEERTLMMDFIDRLMNDPRMGDLYTKMVDVFKAAGGETLIAFTDTSDNRASGYWGNLDNIYVESSPRYDALKAAADDAKLDKALEIGIGGLLQVSGDGSANALTAEGPSHLKGLAGDDLLIGSSGDDVLDGGIGRDTMKGGEGNDIYYVDDVNDLVVENRNDGTDTVITSLASYTLGRNVENLTLSGRINVTGTGNELDNVIRATGGGSASLYGMGGNDTLIGGNGDDLLDGGIGDDRMEGGAGNDTYVVSSAKDVVIEGVNAGIDLIRSKVNNWTLGANIENLTYTGASTFLGTGNELDNVISGGSASRASLYGMAGNDTLIGTAGNDILDGGVGNDVMRGGAGNDIYYVDSEFDVIEESANGGDDMVYVSAARYTLSANVERLVAARGGTFIGNAGDNTMIASDFGTVLRGMDGNDILQGGAGDDILDGGTGADRMVGGAGNDIYYVDNAADLPVEYANQGIDEIRTTLNTYRIGVNFEDLTFLGSGNFVGTGNAADNRILGGAGDDVLDGRAGADTMIGYGGNDTYYVDDVRDLVIEEAGGGNDMVYASVSYTLPVNVENLYLQVGASDGVGNDLDNVINGNSLANKLWGLGGNDTIDGGGGNDTIYGGGGRDALIGGTGSDTFVFAEGELTTDRNNTAAIQDFSRAERDKIDLSGLDAILGNTGNDAFRFIGGGAFSQNAGELRVQANGSFYDVYGDTNGDGVADFLLQVTSKSGMLVAGDFVL